MASQSSDAPRAEMTYERCTDRISRLGMLVERANGEAVKVYNVEGVLVEETVDLYQCVPLTRHQFRNERRYRRLLAP